jgi:transcriptional regulator with XRE-family HTH domain
MLASVNPVLSLRQRVGATQAELALRAQTSQPTIAAYESGAKSPTIRTLERLATSVGLELHATYVPAMTREERRSLELHRAIAARLVTDPERVVRLAKRNLARMATQSPGAASLWREWRHALSRPVDEVVEVLLDPRPAARELRHVTPFAGVLTPTERWSVYRRFRAMESPVGP